MAQDKIFLLLGLILLLDTHHDCAGGQKAKRDQQRSAAKQPKNNLS